MKNTSLVAALVIATMVLVACGTDTTSPATDTTSTDTSVAADTTTSSDSSVEVIKITSATMDYDGEHRQTSGDDKITVTLSLDSDNTISDVAMVLDPSNPQSSRYQDSFASAIKGEVIGKTLDQATVDKVAGASYTSEAWNRAIEDIQTQFAAM
ncbi:MAG: FMN-binding protein [Candidatus Peribacteria bacterium]|nr:MAG: FMN-binding protein [Candidatus Peribacteria bacterium]